MLESRGTRVKGRDEMDEQAIADEYSRLVEEQFWASVQQELAEDDNDRYMGSDSDFSDHALGIDY
jgi:hypothetical protein